MTVTEAREVEDELHQGNPDALTLMERIADWLLPLNEPVTVTWDDVLTITVLTVNVAVVLPGGTVTLGGTDATFVLLLLRLTVAPPAGAAALSVTVPVEETPPVRAAGLSDTDETAIGLMVRVADLSVAL